MTHVCAREHIMTRIDVATGIDYDDFIAKFEKAAPEFDAKPVLRITEDNGNWDDVVAAVARNAPKDLMVYAKIDAGPLFSVAGHHVKAVEYLLGNHVIAETMFRHDPKALLYAPLRVLVYSDPGGRAVFCMDRPSTAFRSLGIEEVTAVGESLDAKVASLLRDLGVDPAAAFR